MSAFGLAGLTKIPGAVYNVEKDGFATYDKSYSGVFTGVVPFSQGDIAEEHPNTVLLSMKITETGTQCDHFQIDLHYEGKETTFGAVDISIDFTTTTEPIESHPNFVSEIGGTPTAPLHGARFDPQTGEFQGFPVVDPDEPLELPSRFAGLRSYLMPQETATSNTVELEYPLDIDDVGKIDSPGYNVPTLPTGKNWLNTGIRVQNIANVYFRTQRTHMTSGPRGWIPEVYTY